MVKANLCGLTPEEILDLAGPADFKISHVLKISNAVYKKRINDILKIPGIPGVLSRRLAEISDPGIFAPITFERSSDNTKKYLFRNAEGLEFETVYLPGAKRNCVCVSTQSGCRMGCPFCVTAKYGFHGNLDAHSIVNQIIGIPEASTVTHVVFMGMGEPLDNLENVLKACKIITAEWGLSLSPANVTVSTVGITPGVVRFLEESDCNLTLSLHSPFREERKRVVPVENKYPFHEITEIMKRFPLKKKRRLSIAYIMMEEVNDTNDHLEGLKSLLGGSEIRVNLLPYHPVKDELTRSSSPEKMNYFKHELVISGISASVRKSRGIDISAACGLLASGLSQSR